ncbi:MAG: TIGR03768 family metallophosphoesterase [Bacteroidota bacterium]
MNKYNKLRITILIIIGMVSATNINGFGQATQKFLKVYTTVDRILVPDNVAVTPTVKLDDPANFAKYGYGKYHYEAGLLCQKRLDLMPAGYDYKKAAPTANLLRFFTITDIHLTDKESPCQAIFFAPFAGANGISAYSPLMLYTTQVLDATIKTINDLHKQYPFDFGLSLGDMANSTQYNELRWFIDILDGKNINPDSGIKDDPTPGPNNDFQDTFKAVGLDKSIPWYAAVGNHDHFFMGVKPVNDRIRRTLIGDSILQLGFVFDANNKNVMNERTFSVGTLDCSKLYAPIIGSGVVAKMGKIPTIAPDTNRRSLTKTEFINEFSNTTTLPKGHGFVQSNPANMFDGCYSFEPKSNVPLKIIVIDDTQLDTDPQVKEGIYGHGELGNGRYEWLIAQLKAGQQANQLMIISAHIPIGVLPESPMDWNVAPGYSSETNLIEQLKLFPNLILWVAGHRHLNTITAFASTDMNHPENGFWQVETKSLREFPEQFRTFDIVLNSDNTISIITTDVDPEMKEGTQAAIGRSYAIASQQLYGAYETPLPTGSVAYNAELVKALSPQMQTIIKNKGTTIIRK